MPSFDSIQIRNGAVLDLRLEAPYTIKQLALEDFDRWMAGRSNLGQRVGGPPQLDALEATMRAKGISKACKESVRTLVESRWPTQESLYSA